MMKVSNTIRLIFIVFLMLFFTSCSRKTEPAENPFAVMTGKNASVNLYLFDGEVMYAYLVHDPESMLDELASISVYSEQPYTIQQDILPCFGFSIVIEGKYHFVEVDKKGMTDEKGSFCGHNTDIPGIIGKYELEEFRDVQKGTAHIPCFYYLLKQDNGWDVPFMTEITDQEEDRYGYSLDLHINEESKNRIDAEIRYHKSLIYEGDSDDLQWDADIFYSVQVQDHGKWYTVPFSPEGLYGRSSSMQLYPGQTYRVSLDLEAFYGDLPDGTYRWEVCSGVYCLFNVKNHRCKL